MRACSFVVGLLAVAVASLDAQVTPGPRPARDSLPVAPVRPAPAALAGPSDQSAPTALQDSAVAHAGRACFRLGSSRAAILARLGSPLERWTSVVINGYSPTLDTVFLLRFPGVELRIYHATQVRNEFLQWLAIDSPRYPLGALSVGMSMGALYRVIGPVSSEMDPTATEANLALDVPGGGLSVNILVLRGRVRRLECVSLM